MPFTLAHPAAVLLPARWAAAADELTAPLEKKIRLPAAPWFVLSAVVGTVTTSLVPVLAFGAVAGAAIVVFLSALLSLRRV